jgi:hypothetical protein
MALAKKYFRDSAELPMNVDVTTVITDAKGKTKRRTHSTVLFVFKGYNQEAGKFTFYGRSGWFNTAALRDSLTGHFSAYLAATYLAPKKGEPHRLEIHQPSHSGEPFLVTAHDSPCSDLVLHERFLFPKQACGSAEFRLRPDSTDFAVFQHFSLDLGHVPARSKVPYLGDVQITSFQAEEDFQKAFLPGDPQPFLLPEKVVTTIATDRGQIVITNLYAPKVQKK